MNFISFLSDTLLLFAWKDTEDYRLLREHGFSEFASVRILNAMSELKRAVDGDIEVTATDNGRKVQFIQRREHPIDDLL